MSEAAPLLDHRAIEGAFRRLGARLAARGVAGSPVVPVVDRLLCLLVHCDALELGQGDCEGVALPADPHKHLVLALLLGRDPDDLDLVANPQR